MTRFAIPVLVLVALIAVLVVGLRRDPSYVPSPLIGKPAPEFTLPRLDDPARTIARSDLLGDVSVVNVWATWCGGCRQEHPFLVELARTGGVRIFGLNWKDDTALARQWLAELGNPYTAVAVDQDGRVAIDWGVYGAPETFLVDRDGVIRWKHVGPLDDGIIANELLPALQRAEATR